ncbi:MAG: CapA family protein [Candidatus Nomurabacteria bacterium]|jgi:poly-gamma-glutamate synthesis protein (capsule biosynthesis protein)|nr:CapA family protein [Candidatus Nomurabacteria bacterium]
MRGGVEVGAPEKRRVAGAKKQLRRALWFLVFSGVLWFSAILAVVMGHSEREAPELLVAETAVNSVVAEVPEVVVEEARARWLMTGDVFLGRAVNSNARKSALKTAQPFSKLHTFQRENYTDWIANLECPVTNNGHNEYLEMEKLIFNCDPDYLPEMQKWFSVVSLANNHTNNQGAAGFLETQQHLAENQIQYFGTYDRYDTEQICNVVKITTLVGFSDGTEEQFKLPFAFCGFHLVFGEIPEPSLQEIAKWSAVLPVIALPHSGVEYQTHSNATQEATFRKMIELGADMVIGSHPHVAQNAEVYHGKLIAYSLGNFIFDQWKAPYETFSAVIDVEVDLTDSKDVEEWAKADCQTLFACQEYQSSFGLDKLSPAYNFDILSSSNASKITEKGDTKTLETIKNRLGI